MVTTRAKPKIDKELARELMLTGSNDGQLYKQQIQPIIRNLALKKVKGTYSAPLANKLWIYLVETVAKKYRKDFGLGRVDLGTKKYAAALFMREWSEELAETVKALKAVKAEKEAAKKKTVRKTKK